MDLIVGTSANDSITGLQNGGATETLNAFDEIDLGEGTDSISIINTEAAAFNGALISNVENITYRGSDDAADLDMAFITGETSLNINSSSLGVDVTNLELATALTITNARANFDSSITYLASDVTGTADAGNMTLDGITNLADINLVGAIESLALTTSGSASRLADLTLGASITALTIDAGADLRVNTTFTNAGVTALTVTGAGAVRIDTALAAATLTVDAAAATGAQTLTMGAANQTITTGTADDVIDMGANLTNNDTIDLGDGNDTLRVDTDGLSAGSNDLSISNVEILRLDNTAANAGAIQLDNVALNSVRVDGVNAAGQAATTGVVTLTDIATTITTFDLIGTGADGAASDNVAFNGLDIDYDVSGATNVGGAVININNGGVIGDDFFVQNLTVDNTDTVELIVADIGADAADELTITEIQGNDFTAVTISSNGEIIVSDIDGDDLDTVDVSGVAAGGAAITISDHAAELTITGSGFADTITMTDNTAASVVTVDLGAGSDTYVSVDATDTITTGTGSDTITIQGDANDDANVITDFTAGAGGDVIDLVTSVVADGTTGTDIAAGAGLSGIATLTGAGNIAAGLTLMNGTNADSLSTTDVAARLADFLGGGEDVVGNDGETDELYYIAMDDGTDTGIYLVTMAADGGVVIGAAEITQLLTLQGVADVTTLTSANFADFI